MTSNTPVTNSSNSSSWDSLFTPPSASTAPASTSIPSQTAGGGVIATITDAASTALGSSSADKKTEVAGKSWEERREKIQDLFKTELEAARDNLPNTNKNKTNNYSQIFGVKIPDINKEICVIDRQNSNGKRHNGYRRIPKEYLEAIKSSSDPTASIKAAAKQMMELYVPKVMVMSVDEPEKMAAGWREKFLSSRDDITDVIQDPEDPKFLYVFVDEDKLNFRAGMMAFRQQAFAAFREDLQDMGMSSDVTNFWNRVADLPPPGFVFNEKTQKWEPPTT